MSVNPELATDLSKSKATDLSKAAIEQRARQAKLEDAAAWARTMSRAFKGISRITRRGYAQRAVIRAGLVDDADS